MKSSRDLLNEPIPRLLLWLSLPALIGFIFNTLYNVIDVKFADWWPDPLAKAALSATFPPFFFQLGVAVGIYQSATALIANALGASGAENAQRLIRQILLFSLLAGSAVMLLGFSFIDPLYRHIFGLEGQVLTWARAYMLVIFIGTPWIAVNFALYAVLSADGNNLPFGISLVIAFCANWLLNWFFMFALGWGVFGLAVSTLLIQGPISSLYVGWEIRRGGYLRGLSWRQFNPDWAQQWRILQQAFPASLTFILVAVGIGVTQSFIEDLGEMRDIALAGFGAATRLEQLLTLPVIGIGIGAMSILGQNYGAGRYERVRTTLKLALGVSLGYSLLAAIAMVLLRAPLTAVLISPGSDALTNAAMAEIAQTYLRLSALVIPLFGVTVILTNFMIAIKRPSIAAINAGARLVILPLMVTPILFVLRDGPDFAGIAWSYVISSTLVMLLVIAYIFWRIPVLLPRPSPRLEPEPKPKAKPDPNA